MEADYGKKFEIKYEGGKRYVYCSYCNQNVERTIVTHLKSQHPTVWAEYLQIFSDLRKQGQGLKKIMWRFGRVFSWTVIDRALAEAGVYMKPSSKNHQSLPLQPVSFKPETTSLWSFENRGKWALHDGNYRGNWAAEVPRNLILRYSKEGDLVVDPFIGGGTTAIECLLLDRDCIGVDINPAALEVARSKLRLVKNRVRKDPTAKARRSDIKLLKGDARSLSSIREIKKVFGQVQLVCAHPPYLDIIEYTRKNPADLSTITDYTRFVREFRKVSDEVFQCLKPGGVFCILIGDVRRNRKMIPLALKVLNGTLESSEFDLEEVIIKAQHQTSTAHFWKSHSHKFLRLAHEYLFVLRKPHQIALR